MQQLHKVEISILYTLRHTDSARFTDLMRPTGLESDTFKFHLRKVIDLGYVEKQPASDYHLTASGKEFANNLDDTKRTVQKQPKLSVLIVATKQRENGDKLFLAQKRLRRPFLGFWGCLSGPVQWGEEAEETAERELKKQTGLAGSFTVRSFFRKRDYRTDSGELLEDKLFFVIEVTNITGDLSNEWNGGFNQWMTADEFSKQENRFESSLDAIEILQINKAYISKKAYYEIEEY
jgi:ADP-ribose pyrophosphatase YjhB (NUDIX family)